MNKLIEGQFGHGAIKLNPVHRKVNKLFRKKLGKGLPFDWNTGFDIRDQIGPIKIKNQGSNFSCGGQAGSYFLQIQRHLQNIREDELSAKSIYSPIAYPGGGTTVTALMTQIGSVGANREVSVPSYFVDHITPFTEGQMTSNSWKTDALTSDALTRAGYTPYDIPVDIDDVASNIQNYGAVMWEIRGKNNGTWLTANPLPPTKQNTNDYFYHFMCLIGAKLINGKKTIIALESMGPGVGDNGIQYFTEDWFISKNIIDCFTFIYDTKLVPTNDNNSIWAAIARWFRDRWNVANAFYQTN